jgi:hypothetical protein
VRPAWHGYVYPEIFDSLREGYPGFDDWWRTKLREKVPVIESPSSAPGALPLSLPTPLKAHPMTLCQSLLVHLDVLNEDESAVFGRHKIVVWCRVVNQVLLVLGDRQTVSCAFAGGVRKSDRAVPESGRDEQLP